MRLERQATCIDMDYLPDCDAYDPRKPEYVKAATDCEVAQAEAERLARQVQSLEHAVARRDKLESLSWFFSRKRAHYNQVIAEMREELQRELSVLPASSGKVERCRTHWDSIMKTLLTLGLRLSVSDLASICGLLHVGCYAFGLPYCLVQDFDVRNRALLSRKRAFLARGSAGLLLSSTNFALSLLPRVNGNWKILGLATSLAGFRSFNILRNRGLVRSS